MITFENLKSWRLWPICVFILTKIGNFFFTISSSQKDPELDLGSRTGSDPGSRTGSGSGSRCRSEIPDFQFEDRDPDPKLLISDPGHCQLGSNCQQGFRIQIRMCHSICKFEEQLDFFWVSVEVAAAHA